MNNEFLEIVPSHIRNEIAEVLVGRLKGTRDHFVEFVDGLDPALSREKKWILNLSTQFGCPVNCLFCDAGGGYKGNVSKYVLLEQLRLLLDRHSLELRKNCRKLKVHFSRMGEPAFNPAVLEVLEELPALIPNPELWACVATVFPKTQTEWFSRLLRIKDQKFRKRFQLQFSVNSTDQKTRRRLMPIEHASLAELAAYGREFWKPGDRKIVLNFALMEGVPVDPKLIAETFTPECFAVKLTPLNPTARGDSAGLFSNVSTSNPARAEELSRGLGAFGFDVIISIGDERENAVRSNCGQAVLRAKKTNGAHRMKAYPATYRD